MTTDYTFLRSILADPADDTRRLAYADFLDETAGFVDCPACGGFGETHVKMKTGYGPRMKCGKCTGGKVLDTRRQRAEFIRTQIELSRLPPEHHKFGYDPTTGPVSIQPAGPEYWVVQDIYQPPGKIGDRCDVRATRIWGRGFVPKIKNFDMFGLIITKVMNTGNGWIEYVVKQDDQSHPWAGKSLRKREVELFTAHRAEWFGPTGCLTPPSDREKAAGGQWMVVRRGFIEQVYLTLSQLYGSRCIRCDGSGSVVLFRGPGSTNPYHDKCSKCDGKGKFTGCAGVLFQNHPINKVSLIDRIPEHVVNDIRSTLYFRWFCDYREGNANIPATIFKRLPLGNWRWATRSEADDALSTACVDYGLTESLRTSDS